MASRMQQEQLRQAAGVMLPLHNVPVLPTGLHAWLVGKLSTAVRGQPERTASQQLNDVAPASDQASDPTTNDTGRRGWLDPGPDAQAAELEEARAQEPVLRAQLAELQHLDRTLATRLQALQAAQQAAADAASSEAVHAAASAAAIRQADAATAQRLEALQAALQDVQHLVTSQGGAWLLVAADMVHYLKTDAGYNQCLDRLIHKMDSGGGGAGSGEGGVSGDGASLGLTLPTPQADMTPAEHEAMMQELARLRTAFCLGEMEEVQAKASLASIKAQVSALRQLVQEQAGGGAGYAPWLHPSECERVAGRVAALQREVASLSEDQLPALIDRVGQLQDTYVLQGDYELRAARHAAGIQDKRDVVTALLRWGAQALLLDALRADELGKLEGLHTMVQDLGDTLSDLLAAAQQRVLAGSAVVQAATSPAPGSTAPPPPAPHLSPGSRYHALAHSQQRRQQLQDGSYLDAVLSILHDASPAGGNTGAVAVPPPATVKALLSGLQALATNAGTAAAAVEEAAGERLLGIVAAAVQGATASQELLSGPGVTAVRPVMVQPEVTRLQGELEAANAQLQAVTNDIVNASNAFIGYGQRHQERTDLERSVLRLFHTQPDKLLEAVNTLQARLDALQATQAA